jgi:hypothetical protein
MLVQSSQFQKSWMLLLDNDLQMLQRIHKQLT